MWYDEDQTNPPIHVQVSGTDMQELIAAGVLRAVLDDQVCRPALKPNPNSKTLSTRKSVRSWGWTMKRRGV